MRSLIRAAACFAFGVIAVLLALEALLRALPATSGFNPSPMSQAAPLYNFEPHRAYRYSQTWAMLNPHAGMTNNYGHIAPIDYQAGSRPMIVVGDSFIESLMNDFGDTVQGILGARLGAGQPVYGLGASGLSLSDYVVLARQARDEFNPTAAVFLISDGDISESLLYRPGGYVLQQRGSGFNLAYLPRSPNAFMARVRARVGNLALYDYLRGNLKFSPIDAVAGFGSGKVGGRIPKRVPVEIAAEQRVADWFLTELSAASGVAPECTVLLIDTDRYSMYDSRLASVPKDSPEVRRFLIDRGRNLGFHVVDLEPAFRATYAQTRVKLDHWPVDRHWNRRGHAVAADEVMKALFANPTASRCRPGAGASSNSGS